MTESPSTIQASNPKTRKVSIQDRSVVVGNIVGVNGYRVNRTLLKQRFAEGGYHSQETPHFLLFTRVDTPYTIVVHWLAPEMLDADLGNLLMRELKPLGLLTQVQDFGNIFGAIVCSLAPHDIQRAWSIYATNTLQRYHHFLTQSDPLPSNDSTIDDFAQLYRRVLALCVGERFLDVGCSAGFLPLLVAEYTPSLSIVEGVDIHVDRFKALQALVNEKQLLHVHYAYADVLSEDFCKLGTFDTVTALHLLEHLPESAMYRALENLLRVTSQRLIVAVPYEVGEPEKAYGHEQLFTREKLEGIGKWCLQYLGGRGKTFCEDCAGGLLLVECVPHEHHKDTSARVTSAAGGSHAKPT